MLRAKRRYWGTARRAYHCQPRAGTLISAVTSNHGLRRIDQINAEILVIIAASPRSAGGSSTSTTGLLVSWGRTSGTLDVSQHFLDRARPWIAASSQLKHERWIAHRIPSEPGGAEPAFAEMFLDV